MHRHCRCAAAHSVLLFPGLIFVPSLVALLVKLNDRFLKVLRRVYLKGIERKLSLPNVFRRKAAKILTDTAAFKSLVSKQKCFVVQSYTFFTSFALKDKINPETCKKFRDFVYLFRLLSDKLPPVVKAGGFGSRSGAVVVEFKQ